ncbi:hypothetical protein [Candidatus Phytoplasma oryzae]|nr:hypothetical protein PIE28_02005 [Candidatus Phytoplasma oryzae]
MIKKRILLVFFIAVINLIIYYRWFSTSNFKNHQNKSVNIIAPKIQEIRKWQAQGKEMTEKVYTFYDLNGLGYYQKELDKEQQKPKNEQNPTLIKLYQIRIKTQKEPNNILSFIQKPFSQWINKYNQDAFYEATFIKTQDSLLFSYLKDFDIKKLIGKDVHDYLFFRFKGPRYFLEEDKDYYIGKANLNYDEKNPLIKRKEYHLHFNPVRNTLSVYTHKFNTK